MAKNTPKRHASVGRARKSQKATSVMLFNKWSIPRKFAVTLTSIAAVFGIIFVSLATVMLQFSYQHNDISNVPDADLGIDASAVQNRPREVINIALFGVDSRSGSSIRGRSDSIMIISIDKIHNKIKLISVMRDSLMPIEGYSTQKVNAAYSIGGAILAIKTLNQNFGLNIRHYATVNFTGMADIIDAVGGIEVELTESERRDANIHIKSAHKEVGTDPTPIAQAGKQHLTGAQAVAYARIRHVSTSSGVSADYGRTDRQRYVMEQLFNKALTINVSEYPSLIKTMLKYMETSLDYADILDMAGVLAGGITFEQTRVPMTDYVISGGYMVRGSSTVYYNLKYAKAIVNAFIYDDIAPEDYIAQHGVNKDGWYSDGNYTNRPQTTKTTTTTKTNRTTSQSTTQTTQESTVPSTTQSTESTSIQTGVSSSDSSDQTIPTVTDPSDGSNTDTAPTTPSGGDNIGGDNGGENPDVSVNATTVSTLQTSHSTQSTTGTSRTAPVGMNTSGSRATRTSSSRTRPSR